VSEVPTPWWTLQDDIRRAGLDPDAVRRVTDRSMAENARPWPRARSMSGSRARRSRSPAWTCRPWTAVEIDVHLARVDRDIARHHRDEFLLQLRQEVLPRAADALMREHDLQAFLGGGGAASGSALAVRKKSSQLITRPSRRTAA
jgi:hypothetical protein